MWQRTPCRATLEAEPFVVAVVHVVEDHAAAEVARGQQVLDALDPLLGEQLGCQRASARQIIRRT